jgi:hypothetical protein
MKTRMAENLTKAAHAANLLTQDLREAYKDATDPALEIVLSAALKQAVEMERTLGRLAGYHSS